MTVPTNLQPGDFGVCLLPKKNWFKEFVISLISWGTHSPAYHAYIVDGQLAIVEAEPGGARIGAIDEYTSAAWWTGHLTDAERQVVNAAALSFVGAPYGWYADAAIGVHDALRIPIPQFVWRWLSDGHPIECAQLVDAAELKGGIHLFSDGRKPGQVSPASLYDLIQNRPVTS